MAAYLADSIWVNVSTSGTADFTTTTAVSGSYRTLADASVPNGSTVHYSARTATQFENGEGVYNSGTGVITRVTVFASSAGGTTKANFSVSPTLAIAPLAEDFVSPIGRQCIPIPASAMTTRTTNGAAAGSVEMTTNKNMFVTYDFDSTTQEFLQFFMAMPDSWDEGTISWIPIWSHGATTTNFGVVFSLAAVAISNDDPGDVAFGTAQTSTDTGGTTDDIYQGPESAAITVAGSPAAGDYVMFQIARVPSDGSDTLAVDARLHGIKLFVTTAAAHD